MTWQARRVLAWLITTTDDWMLIHKADGMSDIEDYAVHSEWAMIKKLMGRSTNNRGINWHGMGIMVKV